MDISLESILNCKADHYDDLTLYMHHTYCLENLNFWQDVQSYRSNPSFSKYKAILKNYIAINAPHEINIPCDMRQRLLDHHHTPHCFDEAAESILELIRVNSFLPWYQDHCNNNTTDYVAARSSSVAFSDRWHLIKHPPSFSAFSFSRPSFSSVRSAASATSMFNFRDGPNNSSSSNDRANSPASTDRLSGMFQRKRQALMIRMKKTFIEHDFNNKNNSFSWLAKK